MPRVMEIATPLGEDLLFHTMHAREELSRLSEYQIDLLSVKADIPLDEILGKIVTVKLELPKNGVRYFNGYVTRFSAGGKLGRYNRYFAQVRPWLWFLSRTADCRIFQDKTVPDILKEVFADHSTADVVFELTSSYRKWTYCVQYRETDLNFVSRLMEQEGLYYYFRHTEGHDTLVITDSTGKHVAAAGCGELPFIAPSQLARADIDHISSWDFAREIQPGVYVHDDYDFARPSVELRTTTLVKREFERGDYEVYDYPGEYVQKPDGQQYAAVRIDEFATQFEAARAVTNARGLCVGHLLGVTGCTREDQNGKHLVLSASYDLEFSAYEGLPEAGAASYQCSFSAMSTKQQFRPRRTTPKPFVQGPQTAVVVGPAGEEIYTDDEGMGRVKVQFHWDRRGQERREELVLGPRLAVRGPARAGAAVHFPRIGQEVIVDFLEGDPDQPIITGRVYNAEQVPPYELPDNKTQAGMKSRSSMSGSPDNFNEIRFEDKKGAEQVYIHAEKNQDIEVENDETHWVGHDRKKTIDNDETTLVKHDRTETVDNNETITIHGNRTETVDQERDHQHRRQSQQDREPERDGDGGAAADAQRRHQRDDQRRRGAGDHRRRAAGDHRRRDADDQRRRESVDQRRGRTSPTTVGVESDDERRRRTTSMTVGADEIAQGRPAAGRRASARTTRSRSAKNLVVDAGDSVTIKTGSASITMKKDGTIVIKGKDITIEGSGKINVKASSDIVDEGHEDPAELSRHMSRCER